MIAPSIIPEAVATVLGKYVDLVLVLDTTIKAVAGAVGGYATGIMAAKILEVFIGTELRQKLLGMIPGDKPSLH